MVISDQLELEKFKQLRKTFQTNLKNTKWSEFTIHINSYNYSAASRSSYRVSGGGASTFSQLSSQPQ